MDEIDHLLEVKTRLTAIRGYAQLIEREIDRGSLRSDRLAAHSAELNREILRLIDLIGSIEDTMIDPPPDPV